MEQMFLAFTVIVAEVVVVLTFVLFQKWKKKRTPKFPYPTGPPPTSWLLGNALELPDVRVGGHIDIKFLEWSQSYGTYFTISLPVIGNMIMVAHPELAKHIMVRKNFPKSWTYEGLFSSVVGKKSMMILHGKEWLEKRRAFNPGFAPDFLKSVVTVLSDKLDRFMACLDQDVKAGAVTNTLERSQTFTSDVIVSVAFGEDWGGDKPHQARQWLSELTELAAAQANDPFIQWFGFRSKQCVAKLERQLDEVLMNVLENRLKAGSDAKNSKDVCSIAINQMLEANDGKGLSVDDKISIMHQLKTVYVAGNDTTATLLSWSLWLLAQNESVLSKVREEIDKAGVWSNDGSTIPTYEQVNSCSYLDAVLKEALRMYPPAGSARYTPDVSETWTDPDTGETVALGGAILYVAPYIMHRHPSLWKDPNQFRPERFLDGSEKDIASKFIPFSKGPHDCLGKHFAMLEAKVALSKLCLKYDFECVDPEKESYAYRVTGVPLNGCKLSFSARR